MVISRDLDGQQDSANLQRRAPLVLENVEADAAQLVNVGMVDLCQKAHFGGCKEVTYVFRVKYKCSSAFKVTPYTCRSYKEEMLHDSLERRLNMKGPLTNQERDQWLSMLVPMYGNIQPSQQTRHGILLGEEELELEAASLKRRLSHLMRRMDVWVKQRQMRPRTEVRTGDENCKLTHMERGEFC
jgi:hypothetical protein